MHNVLHEERMATKESIIPVRVTSADRARLRRAAAPEPVSAWLRRIGLEEARRRESAAKVSRLLAQARREGFGVSEAEAESLAAEAVEKARK